MMSKLLTFPLRFLFVRVSHILQGLSFTVLLCVAPVQASESPMAVDGAVTVSISQAKYLYDAGALFIDVRSDQQWQWGHISGAQHLNLRGDFSGLYTDSLVRRDTPIVIYCNDLDCERSAYASYLAASWGYRQVFYFRDGYFSWLASDLPVQRGAVRGRQLAGQ